MPCFRPYLLGTTSFVKKNLSTLNYLKSSPYGCIVWSVSIQDDSLLYHLDHSGQLFEHACHELNNCVPNKKNEKSFSLSKLYIAYNYLICNCM